MGLDGRFAWLTDLRPPNFHLPNYYTKKWNLKQSFTCKNYKNFSVLWNSGKMPSRTLTWRWRPWVNCIRHQRSTECPETSRTSLSWWQSKYSCWWWAQYLQGCPSLPTPGLRNIRRLRGGFPYYHTIARHEDFRVLLLDVLYNPNNVYYIIHCWGTLYICLEI